MNIKSTKYEGLEPFTGKGQTICQPLPESIIEGTQPAAIPFSECRSTIVRFLNDPQAGFAHSKEASRLWVVKAWAMAYDSPLYVTGDKHTGWHSRLVALHELRWSIIRAQNPNITDWSTL